MVAESHDEESSWEDRVAASWNDADDERPAAMWAALERLLAELPKLDATASFECASLHDMFGEEQSAIPLYQSAFNTGLDPEQHGYAVIQLASTLRNVGRLSQEAQLLEPLLADEKLGAAARAFLALTLHDLGRPKNGLRIVLSNHALNVPRYGRALGEYAALLPADTPA
ncbi:MAG: tetratricopeptide repeat protein [Salinibacterium sp.]|nr:tetratricopeptide repeat protein [Salinibacterium sp.]